MMDHRQIIALLPTRRWVIVVLTAIATAFATATLAPTHASESTRQDLAVLDKPAIKALQRRLLAAGCYKGALDGEASAETKSAVDACPDQRPFLRIETGMHQGDIKTIGVDAGCKLLATASGDKTVRLWSLPDGRALRVIRWPIGEGSQGEVNAVALSPDGRLVAMAGWDAQPVGPIAHGVTIYDIASGTFVAHVGATRKSIIKLAFPPDGRLLALTSGGEGVRLIDTASWRELAADTAYGGDAYGLSFGSDGALYTTSLDGTLRRYAAGPALARTGQVRLRGAKLALAVAITPDGKRLAVGYYDNLALDFYDAATLAYRGHADTRSFRDGDFGALAWRADGRMLLGGGLFGAIGHNAVQAFDPAGRRLGSAVEVASDRISALQACGTGFAFASSEPRLGLLDAQGNVGFSRGGVAVDMRRKLDGLLVMPDAKTVRFELGRHDTSPVAFDLAKGTLKDSPAAQVPYGGPITGGLPIKGWDSTFKPSFAGRPIMLEEHEVSRALAVKYPASGYVLGTSMFLRAYDDKGTLFWKKSGPGETWGLNFSIDGQIVVAPTPTAPSTGIAGRTAPNCWLFSSTRTPTPGSRGRRPAITKPRRVART